MTEVRANYDNFLATARRLPLTVSRPACGMVLFTLRKKMSGAMNGAARCVFNLR
jgi:hypothetical protein